MIFFYIICIKALKQGLAKFIALYLVTFNSCCEMIIYHI